MQQARQSFIKPVRCRYDGKSFDSIAEKDFYRFLKGNLPDCTILRPCEIRLTGKVRSWKCDFGIAANTVQAKNKITRLCSILHNTQIEYDLPMLYIEYKGTTDLTTGLARLDKNFVSRINHLVRYEPRILASTICIGKGSGGVLTYCTNNTWHVMPIHTEEFFKSLIKEIHKDG